MYNKEMIEDFINYRILVIPYTETAFMAIILPLNFDFIILYIVERREKNEQ